jgi:hypothetical protein
MPAPLGRLLGQETQEPKEAGPPEMHLEQASGLQRQAGLLLGGVGWVLTPLLREGDTMQTLDANGGCAQGTSSLRKHVVQGTCAACSQPPCVHLWGGQTEGHRA